MRRVQVPRQHAGSHLWCFREAGGSIRAVMTKRRRIACLSILATIAIVAPGCGGATPTVGGGPSSAHTGSAHPSETPTTAVSNPFTVVARYRAASLGLKQPADLAIGPDGNLYVTDFASQTVSAISPAGKLLRRWGRLGHGPGQFSFHMDVFANPKARIAVGSDGKVYVSDSGNCRVEVFSPTGAFIRQLGSCGSKTNYQFQEVSALAVDSGNDLYVGEGISGAISKFSPTGKFIWRIGGFESRDPDLRTLYVTSVDSHGRLVAGADDQRIVYIDSHGRKVDAFGIDLRSDNGPCDVTVDAGGNTFASSCGGVDGRCFGGTTKCIELVFDRSHRLVGAWYDSPFAMTPRFGFHGEAFTFGNDSSILELKVALPGA
jgi:DNA-binding beta-propeller fold protein YncE